jgi:oligoribonuclease
MDRSEYIPWIDVESTGFNPFLGEKLLEVACIITDTSFAEVGEPLSLVISYTGEEASALREAATPFVQRMHDATGLWDRLSTEGIPAEEVDQRLLEHIHRWAPQARSAKLGGNSITLDRNFLEAYLPRTYGHLHYRNLDVSSVQEFLLCTFGEFPLFEKKLTHSALADIRESIAEAKFYRDVLLAKVTARG